MSQHDSDFYKPFIWVLGALLVFTFFIAIVANIFSPENDYSTDELVQQSIKKQIAPVGISRVLESAPAAVVQPVAEAETATDESTDSVAEESTDTSEESVVPEESSDTADPAVEVAETVTESTDESAETENAADATTEEATVVETTPAAEVVSAITANEVPLKVRAVVATNCAGCHQEGVKGAQRSDDTAAWQALSEKGLDALTASVINGKGEMLPRAETQLTDEEIALAVRYMVTQATGAPVGEATAVSETSAVEQEEDTSTATEQPDEKNDEAATEETSSDAAATAVENTEAAVVETATATAATNIPANVQSVVDTLCTGCHLSGVANAPKIGDKAAWEERLSAGMDALVASAIKGKGAMPARGGSQLSDAELRLAIEYLSTKE